MGIGLENGNGEVSSSNPLPVNLPLDSEDSGFVVMACESDPGGVGSNERDVKPIDVSTDYRMRVGVDTLRHNSWFPGTVLNSKKWQYTAVTQTVAVAGGFLKLNAGLNAATTTSVWVAGQTVYPVLGTFGLWMTYSAIYNEAPQVNNICFIGLVSVPGLQAAVADGVGIRLNASGAAEFVVMSTTAGVDRQSVLIPNFTTMCPPGTCHNYEIFLGENETQLWIDDLKVASLDRLPAAGAILVAGGVKAFALCQNIGVVPTAQQVQIGFINITQADEPNTTPIGVRSALMGDSVYQSADGATVAGTVGWANNANPTAAVPTNTTAALGNTFGGQFLETYTMAMTIDGIIDAYQVPALTQNTTAKQLVITGITVWSGVSVLIAGGPIIEQWGVAFGSTGVSLLTADGANTKAPTRKVLGMRTVPANAPVGTDLKAFQISFENSPIVLNPGEFIHVFKKNAYGTVCTAGQVAHLIDIAGYPA